MLIFLGGQDAGIVKKKKKKKQLLEQ